jgi:hypothetical protein
MRAIFIILLAANLVFFGYQFFFVSKDVVAPDIKTKIKASVHEGGLQLLAEQNGALSLRPKIKSEAKIGPEAAIVDDGKRDVEFCTMLGPYGQLLQAEYAMERLTALGAAAHITPVEIKEGESYWVYLKPEMSEKEALRRLYELQKKNIESHIIAKGELTNGISFGRFADYIDAEARSADIKSQGYEAEIKMLPKMIQETWVVIDVGFAEKIDETVWSELLSKETGLEKRQNFCLGVASQ